MAQINIPELKQNMTQNEIEIFNAFIREIVSKIEKLEAEE